MAKAIAKEETRNKYGEAARRIEIETIGKIGSFTRIPFLEVPEGDVEREKGNLSTKR